MANNNTVGNFNIATVDFDTWINEPISVKQTRTSVSRIKKEIVNMIFEDCANINDDPYWIDLFKKASFGKFKRGFCYSDGRLTYRKANKAYSINIPSNPYEASSLCHDFFRTHGNCYSPIDVEKSMIMQKKIIATENEKLTWKNTSHDLRHVLICNYINDMSKIMNLSSEEKSQLKQTIVDGVDKKYFVTTNIILEQNNIYQINGLLWNNIRRDFYIDPQLQPQITKKYSRAKIIPCKRIDKDTIPQFTTKWNKYIFSLYDKKGKYESSTPIIGDYSPRRLNTSTNTTTDLTDAEQSTDTSRDVGETTEDYAT